ncbi:hypothetical protein [Bacillus phage DZ1]|uniref:Uncharacterized protein n=1 Tax=Bacillus phage DZ1 TaxID=3075862 RepID=A0AA96IXB4_9CAUD|nr:hypothetical protein [Bacillus phage DZ1]
MKKVEMVEKIAAMMNLGTVEAKKVIINAVSEWGLQKSENFYDLLVAGEYDKAASRATVADLKEMEEFIAFYKADEPAQEERTVFFSAQEAHNYQAEKARKANNNQVKAHKVGIQLQIDAINEEVVSYEDGDNYVPTHKIQEAAENAYRGFDISFRKFVLTNNAKIAHYSGTDLFPESVKRVVQIVGGKYGVGEFTLSQLAKLKIEAEQDLFRLAEVDEFNTPDEPVEVDLVVGSIVNETRRGFLVLFKEWVIANSSHILNNLHDLDSGMLAVLKISRGDWSVDEYSIRHLGKIYIEAQNELTALQGGAN